MVIDELMMLYALAMIHATVMINRTMMVYENAVTIAHAWMISKGSNDMKHEMMTTHDSTRLDNHTCVLMLNDMIMIHAVYML